MQTSYQNQFPKAVRGLVYRKISSSSRTNRNASAMPMGIGVVPYAGDDEGCDLPSPSNWPGYLEGITGFEQAIDTNNIQTFEANTGDAGPGSTNPIQPGEIAYVLRKGGEWVYVEGAVSKGGQVFVRTAANGGNTQLGAFRGDDDSGNAVAVPGAVFDSSTTGADFAKLRYDFDAAIAQVQAEGLAQTTETIVVDLDKVQATGAITGFKPGFKGKILSAQASVIDPVTTASKKWDLQLEVGSTAVTSGSNPAAIPLTSATVIADANLATAAAIDGHNTFGATDTVSLVAANPAAGGSLTPFAEGEIEVIITMQPTP